MNWWTYRSSRFQISTLQLLFPKSVFSKILIFFYLCLNIEDISAILSMTNPFLTHNAKFVDTSIKFPSFGYFWNRYKLILIKNIKFIKCNLKLVDKIIPLLILFNTFFLTYLIFHFNATNFCPPRFLASFI